MIPGDVLEAVLRQADLRTLAVAETTCSAVRRAAGSITIDCIVSAPPGSSLHLEAFTAKYMGFVAWLRGHAGQLRSVVVTTDDPDMAHAIGTALAKAKKLHTLKVTEGAMSFCGNWNVAGAMAYSSGTPPALRSLNLPRGIQAVDFIEAFAPTLRALKLTVSSCSQARAVFALNLPHVEDLTVFMSYPLVVTMTEANTPHMRGFPKLRHLSLKNMSFMSSTRAIAFPKGGLDTLTLNCCHFLEHGGFHGLRVLGSLTVLSMEYPECLDVSELFELTISMGTGRCVPPHVVFPKLKRYNAEQTDISMRPAQVPQVWSVALGQGYHGDTSWLLDVFRVYHLSG